MTRLKELFKSRTNFEISLKDFRDYCINHSLLIVLTITIIVLAHGVNVFYNSLGIDSALFIQNPTYDYNWAGLGRFGLLFERNILYLNPFVSYYAGILMIVFMVFACVTMYYTFFKISEKDFGFINLCIPLICFTHPIWVEQFLFRLQCAEVACGAFVTALAILFVFAWIKTSNYKYIVFGMPLIILAFASYQSFIYAYIATCLFSFILLNENKEKGLNFIISVKLLLSFAIAFIIYQIIIRYAFVYLNYQTSWGHESKKAILITMINHIKTIIIGSGPHYNLGYTIGLLICFIVLIYRIIEIDDSNSNKLFYFLAFGLLMASPYFLAFSIGNIPLLRSQLALPYCEAFLVMFATYYCFKNKYLKYISLILVFCIVGAQMSVSETYYYTDIFKNNFEIETSNQIIYELKKKGIEEDSCIAILGHLDPPYNGICMTGEIAGVSSYNANYYAYPYYCFSTSDILGVWRCLGYSYKPCDSKQMEEARKVLEKENIPNWPAEGSIVKHDDFYIIKLSEDDLPW